MQQSNRRPIFKAMDYISQNLHLNPTLEEIANAVALSSFHFHRLFRAQVGETVAAFTRRLRMERAAAWLLAFPQEEITGLALRIGFSSSQNFAKAFRAHFAVSPGEFRRRHILATKSKPGNVVVEISPYSHFTAPSIGLLAAHISRLPARRVAYMRRFGPYGKETCQQTHQDLLASLPARTPSQPAGTLCVYWDAPEITSAARCRTDVGVEIGSSEKAGRGIAVQTLSGGIYGVCKFAVFEEQLDPAWEWALAWIAARGFIKSDKPCYEYYYNETDVSQNYYVFDICIPLQTTPEE
ncbi:AraC family transcriptional regulator [Kluyvera cryocrescens]|uniref:AraC family transcriptional regulator n=1 Tax=Kluyvera cryocrescens TaxID=580 RepID=UPI0028AF2AB2|nr:AraC family transcriptional regulator [Kluyvera cryocrescens]